MLDRKERKRKKRHSSIDIERINSQGLCRQVREKQSRHADAALLFGPKSRQQGRLALSWYGWTNGSASISLRVYQRRMIRRLQCS